MNNPNKMTMDEIREAAHTIEKLAWKLNDHYADTPGTSARKYYHLVQAIEMLANVIHFQEQPLIFSSEKYPWTSEKTRKASKHITTALEELKYE